MYKNNSSDKINVDHHGFFHIRERLRHPVTVEMVYFVIYKLHLVVP